MDCLPFLSVVVVGIYTHMHAHRGTYKYTNTRDADTQTQRDTQHTELYNIHRFTHTATETRTPIMSG